MTSFDYRLNPLYPIKECSSCGALYTTDFCCSEGILRDKIICDLDKTPDLSQQSPQNFPKCGNPVDGHYCQGCALLREKFKEDLFISCVENEILSNSFEPSNDDSNVAIALQDPFIVNQDPEDIFFHQCTCELCRNGAHYGYNCPPKVSILPNPKSFNDQSIKELPPTVPSFVHHAILKMGIHSFMIPHLILFMILLTFLTHLRNHFSILVNSAGTMLEEKQIKEEQMANARYWKISACYDDDDDDDDYNFTITPKELDNSLSMGDEHLDTIDSLFDEFVGKLTLLKSIPSGINETDCDPEEETYFIQRLLYDNSSPRPPEEFISKNFDAAFESFAPFPIPIEDSDSLMEEIDLSFTLDDPMPPGIKEDDYDSERDILILEELLSNDSLLFPENESFHFDIPSSSRPPAKPPYGNAGILNVKMMGDISEQKVPIPRLMFTQSTIVQNQEKSLDLLSHQGHEAFQPSVECPMTIYGKNTHILNVLLFHFYPP
nr:hypothetical protein [Tanacetum cinerariifolium]